MSISSLRRRAVPSLIAFGVAAATVLALATPAGASTGTSEISPEQAGYTATGAQFQFIRAQIYLRNPAQYTGEVASFGDSIQLWSSDSVAVVGVTASTTGSGYTPYATIYNRSTHAVIASDPDARWCPTDDDCEPTIGTFAPSGPVAMYLRYDPSAGTLELDIGGNPDGPGEEDLPAFLASYTIGTGESYNQARVGTDFGSTPWDGSYSYSPPAQAVKAAVYSDVSLTSYSGHTATLWSWWVHHALLANTEQQSGSDWVARPTDLADGGASFQTWFVPQSGQGPDQPVRS
jgi:hypothetical protein